MRFFVSALILAVGLLSAGVAAPVQAQPAPGYDRFHRPPPPRYRHFRHRHYRRPPPPPYRGPRPY